MFLRKVPEGVFPHVVIMVALICTTVIGRELFVGGILGSLIVKGMILGTVYLGAAALTGQLRSLISLVKRKKHEEVEMLPMRPILFVCQFCSGSMYIGISAHLKRKQDQR